MAIVREVRNPHLEISKIEMTCDNPICDRKGRRVAEPLCSDTSFMYLLIGASGSGKTNLLISLLKKKKCKGDKLKSYYRCFDHMVICSPSLETIATDTIFEDLPDENLFESLSEEVFDRLDEITEDPEYKEKSQQTCLVIDDCSADLRKKENMYNLVKLTTNRRHRGISIFIVAHSLVQLDPKLRNNASLIFVFRPKSLKEKTFIKDTYFDMPHQKSERILDHIYQNKHDFALIDTSLRHNGRYQFYRNFNRLLIDPDDDDPTQ